MSCYNPMTAYVTGINKDTGKKIIRFNADKLNIRDLKDFEVIQIPCGKCIGCRLKYSRIWADRCMAEASYYNNNVFLTLTYDNDHLPEPYEGSKIHPLVKRDLQLFMKRLRRELPDQKIRFFACGEYGSPEKTFRPHYHLILFNCKLDDVQLLAKNERDFRYYISKTISGCWYSEKESHLPKEKRKPMGMHIITKVNWSTCAYVARYVVKKQTGKGAEIYEKFNYPPEFTLMSRKPGIGKQFFEDHAIDIYYDGAFISTEEGAHRIYPNKYYDNLFDIEYPDCSVVLKENQKISADSKLRLKLEMSSLSLSDNLKSEEVVKIAQTKILKRKEV